MQGFARNAEHSYLTGIGTSELIGVLRSTYIKEDDRGVLQMNIFTKLKDKKYVESMQVMTKTNMMLLEMMSEMQLEYELALSENKKLEEELKRFKQR
jgi:hypothetical protein